MNTQRLTCCLAGCLMLALMPLAHSALIFNFEETGDDVHLTWSGQLDLSAAPFSGSGTAAFNADILQASDPTIQMFIAGGYDIYEVIGALTSNPFGAGGQVISAINLSGDTSGFELGFIYVPENYISNTPLSGSALYQNETLDSLGITQGITDVYTWDTDKITVNAIPEPSIYAAALGLAVLALLAHRNRKRS